MSRNSHNSRGSSTYARNQTSRWRIIFIALVLVLTIGSTVQTPRAQAAPPHERAYIDVTGPVTICLGKTGYYKAIVYLVPDIPEGGITVNDIPQDGVRVEASSSNTDIGDFSSRFHTTLSINTMDEMIGQKPHIAQFDFTAKKVGNTTIWFEALIGGEYATSPMMPVKVVKCKFRVSTISRWNFVTPYGSTKMIAITGKPVMLELNNANERRTASTNVVWVETTNVPKYRETNNLRFGALEVTGEVRDDGNLVFSVKHAPVTFKQTLCAPNVGCANNSYTSTPEELKNLSLPSAYGGTITRANDLHDEGGASPGNITVYVFPIEQ